MADICNNLNEAAVGIVTWRRRGYVAARRVLGGVLLTAAALKTHHAATNPFVPVNALLIVQVEWELLLGLALVTGLFEPAARWAAVVTFAAFSAYALWGIVHASESCGCLGAIGAPPAAMFAFDIAAVAALLAFRPTRRPPTAPSRPRPRFATSAAAFIAAGAAAAAVLATRDVAPGNADTDAMHVAGGASESANSSHVSQTAGDGRIAAHQSVQLRYVEPAGTIDTAFAIHNPTGRPLGIGGIDVECRCLKLIDPPRRIPAGRSRVFHLRFTAPDKASIYHKRVLLRTDDTATPRITVHVHARVGLPLAIQPDVLGIPALGSDDREVNPGMVRVTNDGPTPVRLLYSDSTPPIYAARVPRAALAPGESVDMAIEPTLARPPADASRAVVRIFTDCQTQPTLRLTVTTTGGRSPPGP